MNIFEQATILKLRFTSIKGELTAEQLWDLPLQSKTGFDLDNVAKTANTTLKAFAEESFVNATGNPQKAKYELMMEIVKHIIASKVAENEAARNATARKAERDKLVSILGDKEDEALRSLTPEQIKARLATLG